MAGLRTRVAIARGLLLQLVMGLTACGTLLAVEDDDVPTQPQGDAGSSGSSGSGGAGGSSGSSGSGGSSGSSGGVLPDGAVNPDAATEAGADTSMPPPGPRMFVTSGTTTGNLFTSGTPGIDGADKKCAMAASAAGLGNKFKAFLYDGVVDPVTRLGGQARYYTTGAPVLAFDNADFSQPLTALNRNERGETLTLGSTYVWTGKLNGTCTAWTDTAGNTNVGLMGRLDDGWLNAGVNLSCNGQARLYCFEVP